MSATQLPLRDHISPNSFLQWFTCTVALGSHAMLTKIISLQLRSVPRRHTVHATARNCNVRNVGTNSVTNIKGIIIILLKNIIRNITGYSSWWKRRRKKTNILVREPYVSYIAYPRKNGRTYKKYGKNINEIIIWHNGLSLLYLILTKKRWSLPNPKFDAVLQDYHAYIFFWTKVGIFLSLTTHRRFFGMTGDLLTYLLPNY